MSPLEDPRSGLRPPEEEYRARRDAREATRRSWSRRSDLLGYLRLAVFLLVLASLGMALLQGRGWPWGQIAPLGIGFLLLVVVHDPVVRRRDAAARAVRLYEEGLRRLSGEPPPRPGGRFHDPGHPYAGDLDLFGPGSIFERIDTSRTLHGEDALARRLAGSSPRPPDAAAIRRRQEAVRELTPGLDLRERLAEAGGETRETAGEHRRVVAWAEAPVSLRGTRGLRAAAVAMSAVLLALVVAAFAGGPSWPAWIWLIPVAGLYLWTLPAAGRVIGRIETPARVLGSYERMTAVAEGAPFSAADLIALQGVLTAGAAPASRELRRLRRIVAWTEALRNQVVRALAPFVLWELHCALTLESWRRRCGSDLDRWLGALGELEADASLAAFAYERRDAAFPEIEDDGPPSFEASALGHPLLDPRRCVRNDVALDGPGSLLLVSGSNMSGKSTLLRAIGVNAVLAMSGTVACASRLSMRPMAVATSMRIVDSLQEGTSHFLSELKRIRGVTDLADSGVPLLFLLDEVLHGTNSRERLLGVRSVVAHLLARGAMGMITTHDLAVAVLGEDHPGRVRNVHFADRLEEGAMRFDYRMRPGVVRTTNALRLMRAVGIPVDLPEEEAATEGAALAATPPGGEPPAGDGE